ncbi:MAG: hypothetical protein ACKOVA_05235, partial [Novosphingobium sp.]
PAVEAEPTVSLDPLNGGRLIVLRDGLVAPRDHGQRSELPAHAENRSAEATAMGFDVRGIRPPTVPQGTSRLRISLTLNATAEDVDALGGALEEALR